MLSQLPVAVSIGGSVITPHGLNLGLVPTFFDPLPCTSGYGGTATSGRPRHDDRRAAEHRRRLHLATQYRQGRARQPECSLTDQPAGREQWTPRNRSSTRPSPAGRCARCGRHARSGTEPPRLVEPAPDDPRPRRGCRDGRGRRAAGRGVAAQADDEDLTPVNLVKEPRRRRRRSDVATAAVGAPRRRCVAAASSAYALLALVVV